MAPEAVLSLLFWPRLFGPEPGLSLRGRGQPGRPETGAQHRSQDQGMITHSAASPLHKPQTIWQILPLSINLLHSRWCTWLVKHSTTVP